MNKVILFAMVGFLVACSDFPQEAGVPINDRVGWLHGNCLAIKNPSIKLPRTFSIFDFESDRRARTATATERAQSGDECYALLDDRKEINSSGGYSFYKVESESPVNIGIGYFDLGDIHDLEFEYCSATEGMVFSISRSESKIWEGYYYLGYESEATCQ